MIHITDPELVSQIVRHCVHMAALPDSRMNEDARAAFTRIGQIPLAEQRLRSLTVSIDPRPLDGAANAHATLERERYLLLYYVRNGASYSLIKAVMPSITRARVNAIRDDVTNRGAAGGGRPPTLPWADAGSVLLRWGTLAKEFPLTDERLVILHHRHFPTYSLASIYAVIQEAAL